MAEICGHAVHTRRVQMIGTRVGEAGDLVIKYVRLADDTKLETHFARVDLQTEKSGRFEIVLLCEGDAVVRRRGHVDLHCRQAVVNVPEHEIQDCETVFGLSGRDVFATS